MASTIDALDSDALKALPDDGPVTMPNLMRFRARSRAAFLETMKSPHCQRASVERESACADHAIIAVRETCSTWTKA